MTALKNLIAPILLALFSTSALAITDADVFAYAAAQYPGLFAGSPTAGQYQQYSYCYYPTSGNYLAIDSTGGVSISGTHTGGKIVPVTSIAALSNSVADWSLTHAHSLAKGTSMGGSIQRGALGLGGSVTTFAGSVAPGAADGAGSAASFNNLDGITTDGTNLYVADMSNNKIRKVVIATAEVSTLAGSGEKSSLDGTGTNATFDSPFAITSDGSNLYVTDFGDRKIRKVVIATGEVTTLAGSGELIYPVSSGGGPLRGPFGACVNGIGTAAAFNSPMGITTDGVNLYVADMSCSAIRKIVIATGEVSNLVAAPGGPWTADALHSPYGITTDGINLYVTDFSGQKVLKIVIATGEMTNLAGGGIRAVTPTQNRFDSSVDGTGSAASFSYPHGITTDGVNLYVADWANGLIRQVVIATGAVTTLAGSTSGTSAVDGTGKAASFNGLGGITTDGVNLYVTDRVSGNGINNMIRKIQ